MSVIICTYNRCESLRRTLATCCDLVIPTGVTWELLVVDNNSTDGTKQVCESFTVRLPLRYLFEPRQGKSIALNRGIESALGPLLIFTDDDVDVAGNWIAALYDAAERHPEASFFGGRIFPHWEFPPPNWLAEHSRFLLSGVAVHYDIGEEARFLSKGDLPFVGANLAFRKSIFCDGLGFREDISPKGNEPVRQEEGELIQRLRTQGLRGWYVPAAIVNHRNPPHRMTESYVREWHKGAGMSDVRLGYVSMVNLWFGIPRWYWKKLIKSGLLYGLTRWTRPSNVWLRAEIDMALAWGVIYELQRRKGSKL